MFLKIFFVICIQINFVYNCDDSISDVTDTSGISEEYLNIFRTIPSLFEYVMDLIEEKPEILEKDDISVFTMDSGKVDETSSQDDIRLVADEYHGDSTGATDASDNGSTDEYVDNSFSAEDSYDSNTTEGSDSTSKEDSYEADSTEYLDSDEEEEDKSEIETDPMFEDFWHWFSAVAASRRNSLTSTEIAEKTLEIEKQLEEYNNSNKS